MSERPLCECHAEPMVKCGSRGDKQYFRCGVEHRQFVNQNQRRYDARRVRMRAGGITFHIGYAPTAGAADYLRQRIKEEAPK